jgi:excisionase family DNA binding protein
MIPRKDVDSMAMAPTKSDEPLLLRDHEVAHMLNVSKSKAYLLMVSGEVPGVMRLGRCLRVHRPTLEKWIAEQATR